MNAYRALLLGITTTLLFALPITANAAGQSHNDAAERSFGIEEWFTSGDAGWQISFPYDDIDSGGHGSGRIESELSFKHIDSPITILNASGILNPEWKIHVSLGFSPISGGNGTDTDRDFPSTGGVIVFSESKEDISGDVRLWRIDLNYRKRYSDTLRSPWGLAIGVLHYEDRLVITNGVQTISQSGWWWDPYSNPPLGPFPGLNSSYDFYWNALKVGATREWQQSDNISIHGMLALYPYVNYYGEGFWNLRTGTRPYDFRLTPPSFTHKSTSGLGYEASLHLQYNITDNADFLLGYRYLYLKVENGTDITYFNAGIGIANLDFAEVTRQGVYAGFLFRF